MSASLDFVNIHNQYEINMIRLAAIVCWVCWSEGW